MGEKSHSSSTFPKQLESINQSMRLFHEKLREQFVRQLFTIGYEGADVEQLLATLRNVGIEVLADVRELPLSRKRGLSKRGLAESLRQVGIDYAHYRQLGDPKPGRDAAKSGDYETFERVFLEHLDTEEAQESLSDLLEVARVKKTCILCFERCAHVCHRSYIADLAAAAGFEIYNLVADRPEKYLKDGLKIPRYNPRQSLAAAE
ncbi:DUF488 family protein [Sagittula sp. S175]|uniref:DUF488 domain-containing protein n=1 Tax=Sagittula sp. S175 TaxID=3415129 RepID=UPI003C7CCA50